MQDVLRTWLCLAQQHNEQVPSHSLPMDSNKLSSVHNLDHNAIRPETLSINMPISITRNNGPTPAIRTMTQIGASQTPTIQMEGGHGSNPKANDLVPGRSLLH